MKATYIVLITGALIASTGCANGLCKKKSKAKTTVQAAAKDGHLIWKSAKDVLLTKTNNGRNIPLKFDAYFIEKAALDNYFKGFKNAGGKAYTFNVPMPDGIGNLNYTLRDASTMSKELAAQYPNVYSLAGSIAGKNTDLRLNYDGNNMNGLIHYNDQTYIIQPWVSENVTYYLIYNRNNAADKKSPFEKGER